VEGADERDVSGRQICRLGVAGKQKVESARW
jgi:hypothetical protein